METVSSSTSRKLFFKLPAKNFRKNNRSTGQEIDRSNSRFCNNVSGSHRNIKQKKVKVGGITTLKLPEKR